MNLVKRYCVKCNKSRKLANPKIFYIFDKTLVLSIICSKYSDNNDRIIKEKENIEVLKFFGLIK